MNYLAIYLNNSMSALIISEIKKENYCFTKFKTNLEMITR